MKTRLGLILSVLFFAVSAPVLAEDVVLTVQPEAQLQLLPLADLTLTETTTVTVHPQDAGSPEGSMSEPLPEYCLLSVQISLDQADAVLTPGKMICITDDHRILEAQPEGEIVNLGECQGESGTCGRYRLTTQRMGQLQLQTPMEFRLQPRNMSN
ncbi:hypothetical protein BGP77_02040 [Saccharospirillum sp. MSK14-1]|uniref:hypothetical protein n=1 Tax=Saccharospirillum sp. MSK14-1 TaxID=1897632 RepID=UPI000D3B273B|nr:hypothetical protein [Saccharospirillum sp. MSK14-1]PTY36121.1 hypothetical protein BGP77_02040 [Saccharospirillum sp. MSK14-1]